MSDTSSTANELSDGMEAINLSTPSKLPPNGPNSSSLSPFNQQMANRLPTLFWCRISFQAAIYPDNRPCPSSNAGNNDHARFIWRFPALIFQRQSCSDLSRGSLCSHETPSNNRFAHIRSRARRNECKLGWSDTTQISSRTNRNGGDSDLPGGISYIYRRRASENRLLCRSRLDFRITPDWDCNLSPWT